MSTQKRKSYTGKFNTKVGIEAIKEARTTNEIGQLYGVYPAQVRQ